MSARQENGALLALAFLAVVTVAWWAFALWPVPGEPAAWLVRARFVCFNVGPSGLPDASGWLLLAGQPLGMLAALMAICGAALRSGVRRVAARPLGKALFVACGAALALGLAAAGARVASARSEGVPFAVDAALPETYPRLDRAAPALGLVDQSGARLEAEHLRGRPALVTFAFAHCEAVCPAVVRQAVAAQRQLREKADASRVPRVVVVTLDPWRDTPSRLPALAEGYELGTDGFVLSGEVDEVNALLDRWGVARGRDTRTGEIAHPPLVYVLDAAGRIAFASTGGTEALVELLGRT
jgi:cytochrome oxidase Cu insertion factor (SCO1/SenC/PrrC family)